MLFAPAWQLAHNEEGRRNLGSPSGGCLPELAGSASLIRVMRIIWLCANFHYVKYSEYG